MGAYGPCVNRVPKNLGILPAERKLDIGNR